MEAQELVNSINRVFWDKNKNDDEVANELLDLMDSHMETVDFDPVLKGAHRILNIWSRTEKETGRYLEQIAEILDLKEKTTS